MGRDKAFVVFRGQTLLAHALALARGICPEVRIVGPREKFAAFAPVVEDVFPGQGPLGGIHAALCDTQSPLSLVLAVDVPLLRPEFLLHLITRARASPALATVPRVGGRWQPLCAVYRLPFAARAEAALRCGRNRIAALFDPAETLVLDESELAELSFLAAMFENLNSPAEGENICNW
jgi:molybdopterin-guanine dinucleotide biosynthesis protein A